MLRGELGLTESDRLRILLEERKRIENSLIDQLVSKEEDANRLETDFSRIMEEAYALGYVQEDELRLVLDETDKRERGMGSPERSDLSSAGSTVQRERILGFATVPILSQRQVLFVSLLVTLCFDTLLLIIGSIRRNKQNSRSMGAAIKNEKPHT